MKLTFKQYLFESNKIDISQENLNNIYTNTINRLAYLKYLIDDDKNKENVKKLKDIYNILSDIMFSDGKLRNIEEIISHIKDIQRENEGKIPNLPSDDTLKSLDTKMIKFKDYDKDTFDKYVAEIQNEFKLEKGKESDSDQIFNNDDAQELTKDEENDIIADLKTLELTFKGICRALGIIDITSGLSVNTSKTPDEDEDDANDEVSYDEEELKSTAQALVMAYLDSHTEYNEEEVDSWLEEVDINSYLDNEEDKEKFIEIFKDELKSSLESNASDENTDAEGDSMEEDVVESLLLEKDDKPRKKRGLFKSILKNIEGLSDDVKSKFMEKTTSTTIQYMKDKIDNETDEEKKKQYEEELKYFKAASYDKDGEIIVNKKERKKRLQTLKDAGAVPSTYTYADVDNLNHEAKEASKKAKKEEAIEK